MKEEERIKDLLSKGYSDSHITAILGVTLGTISRARLQLSKANGNTAKVLDGKLKKAMGFHAQVRSLMKSFFAQEGAEVYRSRMMRTLRDKGYSAADILTVMPSATSAEVQKAFSALY